MMYHGVLNVYKEAGFTSHDVVAKLRGITRQKKIGHTGTLDPEATGVLPVCFGKATRLVELLTDWKKTYETVLLLGVATDTQDMTGNILETAEIYADERAVLACVESFKGEQEQIPPMYSAIKVGGKKLYELARKGKTVERAPRRVTFYELTVLEVRLPRVRIRVTCSKGTYIRTLCNDIGARLGCGGAMESLVREQVGDFKLADACKLGEIERMEKEGGLKTHLVPADGMLLNYPEVRFPAEDDFKLHNGAAVSCTDAKAGQVSCTDAKAEPVIRVYDSVGVFVGLYRADAEEAGIYRPWKMFYTAE